MTAFMYWVDPNLSAIVTAFMLGVTFIGVSLAAVVCLIRVVMRITHRTWRLAVMTAALLPILGGVKVAAGQIIILNPCLLYEPWSWEWILLGCYALPG